MLAPVQYHARAKHPFETASVGPSSQAALAVVPANSTQPSARTAPHHFLISVHHPHQAAQQKHVDGNAVPNAWALHFDGHSCSVGAQDSFVHLRQQAQAVVHSKQPQAAMQGALQHFFHSLQQQAQAGTRKNCRDMQQLPEAAMQHMMHNSHATCKLMTGLMIGVRHST